MKTNLYFLVIVLQFYSNSFGVENNPISFNEVDSVKVSYIRKTFYSAVEDEEQTTKLLDYIKNISNNKIETLTPLLLGYYGATETLLGKHAFNPYTKLSKLKSGLEKISQAISQNPSSLEIRFLRFSILHYIPGFLGYSSEREDDLNKIYLLLLKKNYTSLDYSIQKGIIEFVIDSKRLNPIQISKLEKLLAN